jgi:iron complex transport system permease protein
VTPAAPPRAPARAPARLAHRPALRAGTLSLRLRPRSAAVCAGLALAGACAVVASLLVGAAAVPVGQVVAVLTGSGDPQAEFVVRVLRLPRATTAVLVGAALAVSGALFQSLTRNPLGSPDLIGLTQGASAGAVVALVVGAGGAGVAAGALVGGLVTAALVGALAWRGGGIDVLRLVLVGVGVAFTARSAVDLLLTRAGIDEVTQAAVWLTGSLNARTWDDAVRVGLAVALLVPLALVLARAVDHLALGDDAALALGVRVHLVRLLAVLVAVALAAAAVAAAGPVAFVSFVAGPLARRLVGTGEVCVVPAALLGALLVLVADLVATHVLPVALPVGVVTAVAGAPVLLWLLARQVRVGAL